MTRPIVFDGILASHHTYVDLYGGREAGVFRKPPSPVEVYHDANGACAALFALLRDEQAYAALCDCLKRFSQCENRPADCPRALACEFYRDALRGLREAGIGVPRLAIPEGVMAYLSRLDGLPDVYMRIIRVQIEHYPVDRILTIYDTDRTLFYVDMCRERAPRGIGECDDRDLIGMLVQRLGIVVVRGAPAEAEQALSEAGWNRRTAPNGEIIWSNFTRANTIWDLLQHGAAAKGIDNAGVGGLE